MIGSGALHAIFPAKFPSGQGSDFARVVGELDPGVTGFVFVAPGYDHGPSVVLKKAIDWVYTE